MYGVKDAYNLYINSLEIMIKRSSLFKNLNIDHWKSILIEIDKYISRKLYHYVFPKSPTNRDKAFVLRT